MADNPNYKHLSVDSYSHGQDYLYPRDVVIKFKTAERNRATHGRRILGQLEAIRDQYQIDKAIQLPQNIVRDEMVYVQFISEWDYELKLDQLHGEKYKLLSVTKESHPTEENKFRYNVVVMLTKGGISHFIKKVNDYLTKFTKYKGEYTTKPVGCKSSA